MRLKAKNRHEGKRSMVNTVARSKRIKSKRAMADAARVDSIWKRYEAGKPCTDSQLREIGVITDSSPLPVHAQGMTKIADIIAKTFHIDCRRENIRHWRKRRDHPFPDPAGGNLFRVADCLDWYRWFKREVIQKENGNGDQTDLFEVAATARATGDIAREKHEEWLREVARGAWIKKSEHNRALAGIAQLVAGGEHRVIEVEAARTGAAELRALGVNEQIVTAWHQRVVTLGIAWVDRRRREFGKHVKETDAN